MLSDEDVKRIMARVLESRAQAESEGRKPRTVPARKRKDRDTVGVIATVSNILGG